MQTKHVVWIFDYAYTALKERIVELEQEIIRHREMIDEPMPPSVVTKTRKQRLEECFDALKEYRELCQFCLDAKLKAVDKSAEEFARWFKPSTK